MKQRFETMHPGVCLLYFMAVLGCTMVCRHPIYLIISFCCAAGYTVLLRGKVGIRFFMGVALPVCLLSVVLNGWFHHYGVTPLFRLPGGNRVTLEALCQGAVLGGMFGAAIKAANLMKRAGIDTVEDLTSRTEEEMIKVRNLGKKSLEEVIFKLHSLGLELRKEDE